jgi:serine/threonine protein kinase
MAEGHERQVKDSLFDTGFQLPVPIEYWIQQFTREPIGVGKTSYAYKLTHKISGVHFILRMTHVTNFLIQNRILKEIDAYRRIKTQESRNYISNLLYADCPKSTFDEYAYFLFEYVDGFQLDSYLAMIKEKEKESERYIPIERIMRWMRHMNEVINFLNHPDIRIVHKDIKPANLYWVKDSDTLLLFDFDASCIQGSTCTTVSFEGTPLYATPKALTLRGIFPPQYTYNRLYDMYSTILMMKYDFIEVVKPAQQPILLREVENLERQIQASNQERKNTKYLNPNSGGGKTRRKPRMRKSYRMNKRKPNA